MKFKSNGSTGYREKNVGMQNCLQSVGLDVTYLAETHLKLFLMIEHNLFYLGSAKNPQEFSNCADSSI